MNSIPIDRPFIIVLNGKCQHFHSLVMKSETWVDEILRLVSLFLIIFFYKIFFASWTAKTNLFNECLTTLRVRQRNPSWVAALIWRCVSMVHYARTDPGRLEWKDKSLIRTGTWNEWCRATAATAKFRIIIELCAARTEEINRKK